MIRRILQEEARSYKVPPALYDHILKYVKHMMKNAKKNKTNDKEKKGYE